MEVQITKDPKKDRQVLLFSSKLKTLDADFLKEIVGFDKDFKNASKFYNKYPEHPAYIRFLKELQTALKGNRDIHSLRLSPSYEPSLENVNAKKFSYVAISYLEDEVSKQDEYVVFDPFKKVAVFVAGEFAKEKYGDSYTRIEVQSRTQIVKARKLFKEGKIIRAPAHQSSSKVEAPTPKESLELLTEFGKFVESRKTDFPEVEIEDHELPILFKGWLRTNHVELLPFEKQIWKEYDKVQAIVSNDPEKAIIPEKDYSLFYRRFVEYAPSRKIGDPHPVEMYEKWLKDQYGSLSEIDKANLIGYYSDSVKVIRSSSIPKRKASVYEVNYRKLLKVIPHLIEKVNDGFTSGKSVLVGEGMMDLNFDYLFTDDEGHMVVALAHNYEQNGDLVPDPDMQLRINPKLETVEALSFQDTYGYQQVYHEEKGKNLVNTKAKSELNKFLSQWLTNLIKQGHKVDFVTEGSENRESQALSGKIGRPNDYQYSSIIEFENDVIYQMEVQGAMTTSDAQGIIMIPSNGAYLEARFNKEEQPTPVYAAAVAKEILDIVNVKEEVEAPKQLKIGRSMAGKIDGRDKKIQNVLLPEGSSEPFWSQNFYMGDSELLHKASPKLLRYNSDNISEAPAIHLFELSQMSHPNEYGFSVRRSDLHEEWVKRGESVFQELGFPTDLDYPYVNVHSGYRSMEPLGAIVEHGKWWSAVENWRPIADPQKALEILDFENGTLSSLREQTINPGTKKPKTKEKDNHRKLTFDIDALLANKEMVEAFIASSSQKPKKEEQPKESKKSTDPLANEHGVYTQETARDNLETVKVDIPSTAKTEVEIQLAKGSDSLFRYGLDVTKNFGDFSGSGFAPSIRGTTFVSRSEALESALANALEELDALHKSKDHILNNQEKKDKLIEKAMKAVADFYVSQIESDENAKKVLAKYQFLDIGDKKSSVKKTDAKTPNQHEVNQQVENFIKDKDANGDSFSLEDKELLSKYTGSGGLIKKGAEGKGVLYEYYTPDNIVQKMWELAYMHGYVDGDVLEPSAGTGNFLKYTPVDANIVGYETNYTSNRIAEILYPWADMRLSSFESIFFKGNIHLKDDFKHEHFDLVIGNPPYGEFSGKYAGLGEKRWTKAATYVEYFITRSLDLLKPGGLLVFIIPSGFLEGKTNKVKDKIASKIATVLDAYRLPNGSFPTTDIGTDIIVLKRK
ncbi:MAG: DUF1249 domain-containing protein [Cyclobacteriaceae bacterium]